MQGGGGGGGGGGGQQQPGSDPGQRPSPGPRGGGAGGARNDSLSKISLLGQQVFGSEQHQQQNPATMSFSLGGQQAQGRPFAQQGHPHPKQQGSNVGVDDGGGEFPSLQSGNSLGFGTNQVFMNQPMLQPGGADFFKPTPGDVSPGVRGGGVSQESLMGALSAIQQNISHLQSMLPYMNHSQQVPNALVQQQAAAAISQIARVAANMFPQSPPPQQQAPPPQIPQQQQQQLLQQHQQQPLQQHQHPPQQQQQLGQLMSSSKPPSNFYQHCGPASAGPNPVMGNSNGNFSALQGLDGGGQGGTLAGQIAQRGVGGGHPVPNPSDGVLGIPARSASPAGGAQGGGSNAPSQLGNMSSGPRGGKHGSVFQGEPGKGGGDVGGHHLSGGRPSSMEEHEDAAGGEAGGGARGGEDEDDGEMEMLAPGSYDLVEMDADEILAEHTHFCSICGKGFKRDANLRMHMRGHGDEYKTPAALARPDRGAPDGAAAVVRPRRFSCPYVGCKRNKKHRKFQPLKTMLCVKNHYRRSHCPKIFSCSKCKAKKFSVVADLKTHEKHCGCDKWQCSCGTTFSRKDKLFGHIGLFAGHTPAMPFTDTDGSGDLDVPDLGGGGGHPSSLSVADTAASGYGSMASGIGGGGNGMGLGAGGLQGLATRSGGGGLGAQTSSSSDSFPSPGNLLPYLSGNIFNSNFGQHGGGSSSPDRLR